tara:strand:- start:479 stop:697 length:219 start_codon:yes stop_codon:yes gene_type:complete
MSDIHIHVHNEGGDPVRVPPSARKPKRAPKRAAKPKRKAGAGLPKKYAKMGFKKGWREYKKTPAYKRKKKKR